MSDVLLGFLKGFIESPESAGRLLPVTFLPARVGRDSGIHLDSVCKYTSTSLYRGGQRLSMAHRLLGFSSPFNSVLLHFLSALTKHLPIYGGSPSTSQFLRFEHEHCTTELVFCLTSASHHKHHRLAGPSIRNLFFSNF